MVTNINNAASQMIDEFIRRESQRLSVSHPGPGGASLPGQSEEVTMDAGGGKKGGVKADINVTPLVDIVLVLLIIFIVITPAVNNACGCRSPSTAPSPRSTGRRQVPHPDLPAKRDARTG